MAKPFKVVPKGIRLVPVNTSMSCSSDPSPCLIAGESCGILYIYDNNLKAYIECSVRNVVSTNQAQTLTNKTIQCATIASPILTVDDFIIQDNCDNTKKSKFISDTCQAACSTISLTLPDIDDELITPSSSNTLTNKTLTSPIINTSPISGGSVSDSCIDLGTASNCQKLTISAGTLVTITALVRKAGTLYYGTDTLKMYYDTGSALKPLDEAPDTFALLNDTAPFTCNAGYAPAVNSCADGITYEKVVEACTTETVVVTTEAELDTALANAACGTCRDIRIGGSFNLATTKEIPSNTSVIQETNAYTLTPVFLSNPESTTVTFINCTPSSYDNHQVILNAPSLYHVFFDDSICCTDTAPTVPCSTGIRVDTNGLVTKCAIATAFACAVNSDPSFSVTSCAAVATVTNITVGNVTNSTVTTQFTFVDKKIGTANATANYGKSVAVCGEYMAAGSPFWEGCGSYTNAGRVTLRKRNYCVPCMNCTAPCNWGIFKTICAPCVSGSHNKFGDDVVMQGDLLFASASSLIGRGKSHIFKKDHCACCPCPVPCNWGKIRTMSMTDYECCASNGCYFGWSIATCGCYLVIGVPRSSVCGTRSGGAYVFKRTYCETCTDCSGCCTWGMIKKLVLPCCIIDDANVGDFVSICGDCILVGGDGCLAGTAKYYRTFHLYNKNTGGTDNWGEVFSLNGPGGSVRDAYALTGDIQEDIIAIGASRNCYACADGGDVYLYKRNYCACCMDCSNPCGWGLLKQLSASNGHIHDQFGAAVHFVCDVLYIGAKNRDCTGISDIGAFYAFNRHLCGTCNWGESFCITPECAGPCDSPDEFGSSLSGDGVTLVVGHLLDDDAASSAGAIHIYKAPSFQITADVCTEGEGTVCCLAEGDSIINFAACVTDSSIQGLNITTTSNAIVGVSIQNTAKRNKVKGNSLKTGACSLSPIISINGQNNIVNKNEIDTCSSCNMCIIKEETCATGNVVTNNIED